MPKISRQIRDCLFILLIIFFTALDKAYSQQEEQAGDEAICNYMISLAEKARRVPPGLLQAIAQVESGRYVPGKSLSNPWPWTVSTAQEGKFYKTQQEAIQEIEQLRSNGITNIDVGCMQVNLFYHGRGFASLREAINPVNNVAYATEYLSLLFRRYENWGEAVKHYHSSDPQKNSYYLEKVITAWQRLEGTRTSPYIRELQEALAAKTSPPLPPTAENEAAIAKSTVEFAEELRRRVNNIEENTQDKDSLVQSAEYGDELRIWDEWQRVLNAGDIKGKSPDYYINLLEDTF